MPHTKSLTQLCKLLQKREISALEITEHFLKRIENSQLNSFITITAEHALNAAKLADQQLAKGTHTAVTGIPIAYKDIFCTQDIKTSCASKMLDNFISPYDATVVSKLKYAGMIGMGKTNMDEFAMGSSNENSYYGAVKNPWDPKCVTGGSSGGSAAAVAAGLVPAALGTDTGGSIRQPAAFCGISGLKPSYGRISRHGMIAFASSLDQAGPMARSAEDLALLLEYMAGFDTKDSTSVNTSVPSYSKSLNNSIAGCRVGLPKQYFNPQLNPEITNITLNAAAALEKMGAKLQEIDLPHLEYAIPVYYVIASAECSSNLARYDGVRYGYRCDAPQNLTDLYTRSRGEAFGAEVKRRIMMGTYVLSAGYYDAYYRKAQQVRRLIRDDFVNVFKEFDVILAPVTPTPAFKIGEKIDDPITMYLSDIYTTAVNLAGLPALSIPGGFIDNKPIGIQLIANHYAEEKLLNIAHQYQQQTNWHLQMPGIF